MESSSLAILERKLPLRGYPEKELDNVLSTVFKFWLATLLSIKAENEEKLDAAFPAIKKHFWSLGLDEVKKAFELYADGGLPTQPKSNHFDRILVGQIFNDYRKQKIIKKRTIVETVIPDEEKIQILEAGVLRCQSEYLEYGTVLPGNQHIYDFLDERGRIKISAARKKEL